MTSGPGDQRAEVVVRAPADEIALSVADALLPRPLPPALRAFLTACDGARAGTLEVFDTERIVEATNTEAHAWQLPASTVVVGTAGPGRSLVMLGDRDEVCEVDDDPWDARTLTIAADSPLDLIHTHRGVPIRERDRWWALPHAADAIAQTREHLAEDVATVLDVGIASKVGEALPPSLAGFTSVADSLALPLLASEEFQLGLLNHRPACPLPGRSAEAQWQQACAAIPDPRLRDEIRAAPVSDAVDELGPFPDDELTAAQAVRELCHLALLAAARDDLAALLSGQGPDDDSTGRRTARVFLTGHVPVSFISAI